MSLLLVKFTKKAQAKRMKFANRSLLLVKLVKKAQAKKNSFHIKERAEPTENTRRINTKPKTTYNIIKPISPILRY